MLISLKVNVIVKLLKIYLFDYKDKKIIDIIFDKLQ